jgi:hypothetical protein
MYAQNANSPAVSYSGPSGVMTTAAFAPAERFDQLTGTTLNRVTVNGVSGLTSADIPSLANNYLSLGGGTLTGDLIAANIFATTSSSTILATGATTPRALGDIAADVVNVKSFGAKGDNTTDDSAAINAAISYIRNADDAAGQGVINKYELYFPQGKYLIRSPINLTCISDPNGTGISTDDGCRPSGGASQLTEDHGFLPIMGYGAQITCATNGAPCIDGLGSRHIEIYGLGVFGSCNTGFEPSWGLQLGRTTTAVADHWYLDAVSFSGCYTKAAFYNLASEATVIDGDSWFQNQDTSVSFSTSTGPYSAVWDTGNPWQVTSTFVNETVAQDTPASFNDDLIIGGKFAAGNPSAHTGGLWIYGTRRLHFIDTYIVSNEGSCANIYFDGTSAGSLTNNSDHTPEDDIFEMHCEGTLSKIFLITGAQTHPLIPGLEYADHAVASGNPAASVFALDTGVTALTLQNVNIKATGSGSAPKTLWDTPFAYTVSGTIYLPAAGGNTTWTAPGTWTGCVFIGTSAPSCGGLDLTKINRRWLQHVDRVSSRPNVECQQPHLRRLSSRGKSRRRSKHRRRRFSSQWQWIGHEQYCPRLSSRQDRQFRRQQYIGWNAASTTQSGSNNIALGYDIALPSTNGSNQLNIGNLIFGTGINGEGTNLSTGSIGIGTTTPWRTLSVTGTVGMDGLNAITGTNSSLCLDSNKQVVYSSNSDSCASSLRSTKHLQQRRLKHRTLRLHRRRYRCGGCTSCDLRPNWRHLRHR